MKWLIKHQFKDHSKNIKTMPKDIELVSLTLDSYLPLERKDSSDFFFLHPVIFSQAFTIHRTAGQGEAISLTLLPLSLDSKTIIHQPGN